MLKNLSRNQTNPIYIGRSATKTQTNMVSMSRFLTLLPLLFVLSVPNANANEFFLSCMNISRQVHSSNSSSYSSLLRTYQENLVVSSFTSQNPALIVTPNSESEIQAVLFCGKQHGLKIRVRSGGHDYEGLSTTSSVPFIIIDLVNLRSITINMTDETAWVQAGAILGEVYYAIAQKSSIHAFPAGICPSVGVGGHISGGGIGTLIRKYGLASDNVVDACLMDVNGRILNRQSMGEDLFWAIRGGGGANFGIILSWKIKLVRVPPTVTVFNVAKTTNQGVASLLQKWQHIAHTLDENLFIRVIIQSLHAEKKADKTVHIFFNSLFVGSTQEVLSVMNTSFPELGLTSKDCREMSWINSTLYFYGYQHGEPTQVLLNRTHRETAFFKGKSDFVKTPLPETVFNGIYRRFLAEDVSFIIMDPYGGIMDKISEYDTPFAHRKGYLYNIQYIVKWDKGVAADPHIDWLRELYSYMSAYVSDSPRAAYLNYRDLDLGKEVAVGNSSYTKAKTWGEKYFNRNFVKLACVKGNVDPDNYFRNEQSIPPLLDEEQTL